METCRRHKSLSNPVVPLMDMSLPIGLSSKDGSMGMRAQKVAFDPSALVSGQVHAKIISASDSALIEGKVLEAVVEWGNSLTERLARVN